MENLETVALGLEAEGAANKRLDADAADAKGEKGLESSPKAARRESAEKQRLLKEKAAPEKAGYFIVLMVALTLIYIVDELASNMNGAMQTYAILDLFHVPNGDVNTSEYTNVVGTMALLIGLGMAISTVIYIVAIKAVGSANIGLFGIALGVPFIAVSCLIITRIQETKGADLNAL